DLLVNWESDGPAIDGNCDGLLVDDETNTIIFATSPTDPGTNSLNAYNSVTGALKWSHNAGSIVNRPMLKGGPVPELYVASTDGRLQKRNPFDGSLVWALPTRSPIVRNISPEFRAPQPTRIFFVAEDGQLHTVLDNFPNPVVLPPVSPGDGSLFSTAPA